MLIPLDDIPSKKDFEHDLVAQMDGREPVSLIFVDLDGFEQVNDQHGHPEGDRCLMESAAAMSRVIDGRGRLYRPGGDEFWTKQGRSRPWPHFLKTGRWSKHSEPFIGPPEKIGQDMLSVLLFWPSGS